ncbi:hypothetical protein BH11ARM1_BH11ARM1_17310 [soil metagenome]
MPRQVPLGGEMFTRSIADAYTLPMGDAEQMKREKLVIPESAGINSSVSDPFGMAPAADAGFQAYNPFGADDSFSVPGAVDYSAASGEYASEPTGGFEPLDPDSVPHADATTELQAVPVTAPVPVGDPEAQRLYSAVAPVLDELSAEIRRSIDYYRSRGGEVHQVELCGGGTKINGLVGFLERSLGIPVEAFDPTRRLTVNARKVPPAFVEEHRQEFAVAIGNGLHIFFD